MTRVFFVTITLWLTDLLLLQLRGLGLSRSTCLLSAALLRRFGRACSFLGLEVPLSFLKYASPLLFGQAQLPPLVLVLRQQQLQVDGA